MGFVSWPLFSCFLDVFVGFSSEVVPFSSSPPPFSVLGGISFLLFPLGCVVSLFLVVFSVGHLISRFSVLCLAPLAVSVSISVAGFLAAAREIALSCVLEGRQFLRRISASSPCFLLSESVFAIQPCYWFVLVWDILASQSKFMHPSFHPE